MTVTHAPDPTDILWENLEVGALSRLLRRTLSAFAAFIVIVICAAIIVSAKFLQQTAQLDNKACATPPLIAACGLGGIAANLTEDGYKAVVSATRGNANCTQCVCNAVQVS